MEEVTSFVDTVVAEQRLQLRNLNCGKFTRKALLIVDLVDSDLDIYALLSHFIIT